MAPRTALPARLSSSCSRHLPGAKASGLSSSPDSVRRSASGARGAASGAPRTAAPEDRTPATPPTVPPAGVRSPMGWRESRVLFTAMWNAGRTPAEIAERFEIKLASVMSRARDLGLSRTRSHRVTESRRPSKIARGHKGARAVQTKRDQDVPVTLPRAAELAACFARADAACARCDDHIASRKAERAVEAASHRRLK